MNNIKVGVIGTHFSGKTSLCHQVVGILRSEGYLVDYVREAARNSYYLASGVISFAMQLDILNRQISEELEMARTSELVICDRTVIDVLAYTRQLNPPINNKEKTYEKCIEFIAKEYVKTYDLIFFKLDYFNTIDSKDPLVIKDDLHQERIYKCLHTIIEENELFITNINSENGIQLIVEKIKTFLISKR